MREGKGVSGCVEIKSNLNDDNRTWEKVS